MWYPMWSDTDEYNPYMNKPLELGYIKINWERWKGSPTRLIPQNSVGKEQNDF